MPKTSQIEAILSGKCPRCRKGDMFKKHILNPFSITDMHKTCEHCQLTFEKEPMFYNGAMYISYVISTGLFFVAWLIIYLLLGDPDTWVYISIITVLVLLIFPFNFKYSRVIFLHLFSGEKYQEEL